jgi:surfactin synthase thioesterase subunit
MTALTDPAIWLACTVSHERPGHRLICFPHAGGSASFFRDWGDRLPGIEVHSIRYPGRAERIDEASPTDLRQLGRDIAAALILLADRPLALFGHSMGAVVALETARSLESRGIRVAHLFASGSRNAAALPTPVASHQDAGTIDQLVGFGGTDPELAADPLFQELVLPYVHSDGRMFHAYELDLHPPLHCPVTTIVGDRDTDADRRPWNQLTRGPLHEHPVVGDHFYLIAEPPYALLRGALNTPARRSGR